MVSLKRWQQYFEMINSAEQGLSRQIQAEPKGRFHTRIKRKAQME